MKPRMLAFLLSVFGKNSLAHPKIAELETQLINSPDDPSIFDFVELCNAKMMTNSMGELAEESEILIASVMFAKGMRSVPNKVQHIRLFEILAVAGVKSPEIWRNYVDSLGSIDLDSMQLIDLNMIESTLTHAKSVLSGPTRVNEYLDKTRALALAQKQQRA